MNDLFFDGCVQVIDFVNADFSYFKNCESISNGCLLLKRFYLNNFDEAQKPFCWINLCYQQIVRDNRYKYIVINIDGDMVCVLFKIIEMGSVKQIRLIGIPLSLKCDVENVKKVLSIFLSNKYIKIVVPEYDNIYISGKSAKRLSEYDDYYITLGREYCTSKFKSKHYINKMLNDKNVDITTNVDVNAIYELRSKWKDGMITRGHKISRHNDTAFNKLLMSKDERVVKMSVNYKGDCLAFFLCVLSDCGTYADCVFIHHLWCEAKDDVIRMINKNVVSIQKYVMTVLLPNCKRVYFGGCRTGERRLLAHKQQTYKSKIEYFQL